jgi:predicted HTH domain antitoxin
MKLEIEDELMAGVQLSPKEARLDFAIGLFADRRVTLGRASRIAQLSQTDFLRELGQRGIPIHYDVDDFEADVRTIAALKLRLSSATPRRQLPCC